MLLPGRQDGLNYGSIFRLLSLAVGDPKERVKAGGLEGMAVLARYVAAACYPGCEYRVCTKRILPFLMNFGWDQTAHTVV